MKENNCVYVRRNIMNGKILVGRTTQEPENRLQNLNIYWSTLESDFAKFGVNNFEYIFRVDGLDDETADILERLVHICF